MIVKSTLPQEFYARPTPLVAQELLGKLLVREYDGLSLSGIITETEAYTDIDPACHAYRGKTERTKALFGPVGHAYIYFIYGNHYCLNIVARDKETLAGGVLIRATQPVEGIEYMKENRKMRDLKQLTNGPGKVAQALNIDKQLYGLNIMQPGLLYVTEGITIDPQTIKHTPRIGISRAQAQLWRFIYES